jgi:AsmA protein
MKKLGMILGALLVLIIGAAIILPMFISADSFKPQIIAKVQEATGRTLTINGKLSMKLFPTVGVTAEDVTLSNPKGFDDKAPFVALKLLDVHVALLPLLAKQIEVKSFTLENPQLLLHVNKDGAQNWAFGDAPKQAAEAKPASSGGAALPGNIMLGDVELKNGRVTYIDDTKKTRAEVSDVNVSIALKGLSSPFSVKGSGAWNKDTISVDAKLDSLQSFLDKKKTSVEASVKSARLNVDTKGVIEGGVFVGKADVVSSSIKELLVWMTPGSKPIGTPAMLALNVSSDVKCGADNCDLPNIAITLDKIKAKGSVKVSLAGAKPEVALNLATDMLDLNAFMAEEKHASVQLIGDAEAAGGHWSDAPIDVSGLQAVNLNAVIKTGGLLVKKFTVGATTLNAKINNGVLTADVADAQMYDGKGSVAVRLSGGGIDAKVALKGVQLEPLLKDGDFTDRMSGACDMQFAVNGRGNNQRDIVATLAGSGQAKVDNGVIKGVNLADMARNVSSAFIKTDNGSGQKTVFTEMGATFTIAQGVVSNKDLSLKTQGLNLGGQGTVNLPVYTINYRLTPTLVRSVTGADGKATDKNGLAVPVLIDGSLDSPSYRPDAGAMLQNALQDPKKFRDELKNSGGSVKDQLKDPKASVKNIKGLLKGFGGN